MLSRERGFAFNSIFLLNVFSFRILHSALCILSLEARLHDCLKDLRVPGAATQISCQARPDLFVSRVRYPLEQFYRSQNHARSARAALGAAELYERFLNLVKPVSGGNSFNARYLSAFSLDNRDKTTVDQLAVEQYRTGPAFALAAAFLRSGQPQIVTQHVQKPRHGVGLELFRLAVNFTFHRDGLHRIKN